MVGSGGAGAVASGGDRSKEAVGMMALHDTLRNVCLNTDWAYSVFWTIRPRPRVRGGNGCKVGDDNGSLMLMWEDGFCRGRAVECIDESDGEDPVQKAFRKMSIQLYNYGEGLMGKVASDKCHKWVFKEPSECEPNASNYWQSSFDALPTEWTDQFESGIQTIAVIQAGHGLLQLGSCKIIPEDLHFVLRMRHTFESLDYQSGFYLSQIFSSSRNAPSSSPIATSQAVPPLCPPPTLNWSQRMLPSAAASMLASPTYQRPPLGGFAPTKDETHMFLMPNSTGGRMEEMPGEHESDIKWPNGLSFFNALTGRAEVFNPESLGNKPGENHMNEFPSLDESHPDSLRKMENKFRRSFTLPARMASSSSSTSLDHHHAQHPPEYRPSETGMYQDLMEPFME